jgi:hypothetical protein
MATNEEERSEENQEELERPTKEVLIRNSDMGPE